MFSITRDTSNELSNSAGSLVSVPVKLNLVQYSGTFKLLVLCLVLLFIPSLSCNYLKVNTDKWKLIRLSVFSDNDFGVFTVSSLVYAMYVTIQHNIKLN